MESTHEAWGKSHEVTTSAPPDPRARPTHFLLKAKVFPRELSLDLQNRLVSGELRRLILATSPAPSQRMAICLLSIFGNRGIVCIYSLRSPYSKEHFKSRLPLVDLVSRAQCWGLSAGKFRLLQVLFDVQCHNTLSGFPVNIRISWGDNL